MAAGNGSGQGRVALVTGGMGGLGESIATKMVNAGYRVVVTYSPGNTKHCEWVAGMKDNGYDIVAVQCDVADIDSCARAVAEVHDKVGAVDILVVAEYDLRVPFELGHGLGIREPAPFAMLDRDDELLPDET